jgi:hypothetical protein
MQQLAKLARLAPECGALGVNGSVRLHVLRSVIDVVLALTTLLRGQSLPELALGLVLRHLILDRFVVSAHGPIVIADHLLSQQIVAWVRSTATSSAARSGRCPPRP